MTNQVANDRFEKGRGAQFNPKNRFLKGEYVQEHVEGIDDWETENRKTEYIFDESKTLVNDVTSPDVGMMYSANPYQGCEHGCIYCYARNSHEYWGYSAGLDFESRIVVKKNAPALLRKFFENKNWQPAPISLSGNTDCYQPIERKMRITRQLLEICLEFRNPVGILSKNALVLRDMDIIQELADYGAQVDVCDPWIARDTAREEYGLDLVGAPATGAYDAVVLAVAHQQFLEMGPEAVRALGKPRAVLFDVKSVLPKEASDIRL